MRIKGGGTYREQTIKLIVSSVSHRVKLCLFEVFLPVCHKMHRLSICPACPLCRKDITMIIKYKFANGDVSVVEVSEDIGKEIVKSRKKEHANDEKQRYHCYSIDALDYEGEDYAVDETAESILLKKELMGSLHKALAELTPIQRRRLEMYASGMTYREIASIEGVIHTKVEQSIYKARKKIKNFLL